MSFNINIAKPERKIWLMNIHTGSVDEFDNWEIESHYWENPSDFDELVEVEWDEQEENWIEV